MQKKTFRITYPAVLSALTVICLVLAGVLPSGQLGLAAVASLFSVAAVADLGAVSGLCVYAVSAALGFLLAGDKTAPFLYLMFFGWYPAVKLWCDRISSRVLCWGAKFLILNLAVTAVLILFDGVMVDLSALRGSKALAYIAVNLCLVPYDMGISRLAVWYREKLSPKIRRG